jgi:hypothetical protein
MTAKPITDSSTLRALVAAAKVIRSAIVGDFTIGTVGAQTMVGYLDKATGSFVAATIEPNPVIWHGPPPGPEGAAVAPARDADSHGPGPAGGCSCGSSHDGEAIAEPPTWQEIDEKMRRLKPGDPHPLDGGGTGGGRV